MSKIQIHQCFNCQSFGHSSTLCGRSPKCVKCDQEHASKDYSKPADAPPKCINCGEYPANFTGYTHYIQQLNYIQRKHYPQQQKSRNETTRNPLSVTKNHSFLNSRRNNHLPHPTKLGLKLHLSPHHNLHNNASVHS
jgi:hypothetical protein